VKGEMSKTQREYYLRQQLKAIKEELGELGEEEEELDELQERLKKAGLPPEVDKVAQKELNRLKSIPTASSEYPSRTYRLDRRSSWSKKSRQPRHRARAILDADHIERSKAHPRVPRSPG
jgi:ATP-dependent Lon protease